MAALHVDKKGTRKNGRNTSFPGIAKEEEEEWSKEQQINLWLASDLIAADYVVSRLIYTPERPIFSF
jgi:hypothetical protein